MSFQEVIGAQTGAPRVQPQGATARCNAAAVATAAAVPPTVLRVRAPDAARSCSRLQPGLSLCANVALLHDKPTSKMTTEYREMPDAAGSSSRLQPGLSLYANVVLLHDNLTSKLTTEYREMPDAAGSSPRLQPGLSLYVNVVLLHDNLTSKLTTENCEMPDPLDLALACSQVCLSMSMSCCFMTISPAK